MSFILSIFLCFALAFSGTGALPAEPETATTWTIRNVSFSDGTDSFTLDPELRFTTAVGGEKAGMHFEIDSGDRALLPVTAEITNDEVRFAMSNGGQAYRLSAEEFAQMADLDGNEEILAILGDLFTSYGALLGTVYGDAEEATAYSQAMFTVMVDACGGQFEPVEVECNGQTLEGQKGVLTINIDAAFKLMDGLRTCGIAPMEQMMDSVLALCNLAEEGAEYASFADLAAEIDRGDVDFSMPMTITFAAKDEMIYCLVECDFSVEGAAMQMREEISYSNEKTDVNMNMVMTGLDSDSTTAVYIISAEMQGPINAPTAIHMNYDIVMTTVGEIVYEAEEDADAEVNLSAGPKSYTDQMVVHMTLDSAAEDGLDDAQFVVNFQQFYNGVNRGSGVFRMTVAERREADDSVTADVAFNVYVDDAEYTLSFEVNRAEAAPEDYFDGLDVLEITAEEFDTDGEEPSAVMSALQGDAMRMAVDAMQLSTDESIRQAMEKLGGPTE